MGRPLNNLQFNSLYKIKRNSNYEEKLAYCDHYFIRPGQW